MEFGYDAPISSEVEQRFQCPICLLVLRNPVQTACGHRFCNACIHRLILDKNTVLTCPIDKTYTKVSKMFPDLATEREILSLPTKCVNVDEACTWHGELRDFDKHRLVCDKERVICANGCLVKIKRQDLEVHEANCSHRLVKCQYCMQQELLYKMKDHDDKCAKFPVTCTLCNEATLPRGEMEKHRSPTEGQCGKSLIKCPYNYVGCEFQIERQLMKEHTQAPNALHEHMEMALKWMVNQGTLVKELSQHVRHMHETSYLVLPQLLQNDRRRGIAAIELRDRNLTGKLHWKIKLGGDHRLRHNSYASPAFYTGCPGYRVQLSLNLEGPREGNIRFTSLTIALLAGDYDNQAIFPFNATCIMTLYDQAKCPPQEKDHITSQIVIREIPRNSSANNMNVNNIYKREISKFIRRPELIGPNSRYIKNGCLHFEATVLHSYCPPPGVLHTHSCNCPALVPNGSEIALTPKQSITFHRRTSSQVHGQSPSMEEGQRQSLSMEARQGPRMEDGQRQSLSMEARQSPRMEERQRQSPRMEAGQRHPSMEEGQRQSPSMEEGQRQPPSMEGQRQSPSMEEGQRQPPSMEEGQRQPPSMEEGQRQPPSMEEGQRHPSMEEGQRHPSMEEGQRQSPSMEEGQRQSPSMEGQRQSPSMEEGQRQSPSMEEGQRQSPSMEEGQRQSPSMEGQRQPPSMEEGQRQPPSMEEGQRQPPSMEAGQPASMEAGQPASMEAGQPASMEAGQPPSMEAGQPPSMEAGQPPSMEAGQPPSMEAGQPPSMEAGQPPSMEAGQPPSMEALVTKGKYPITQLYC